MQRPDSQLMEEAHACPFLLVAGAQRLRLLAECLASLSAMQRELILLHYEDGVSLAAIAGLAGVSVQTVSKWHRRALDEMLLELAQRRITGYSQM